MVANSRTSTQIDHPFADYVVKHQNERPIRSAPYRTVRSEVRAARSNRRRPSTLGVFHGLRRSASRGHGADRATARQS